MKKWEGYQKGINLGGWFSQCDHTKDRYDNFIKRDDIKKIKSWGLDHIRLPIDYELLETSSGEIIESGYQRIGSVIEICRAVGLNMILDLHKTCGYSFDENYKEKGFFYDPALQERFYVLWERIAKRFGDDEDIVAFELLNEVTEKSYCDIWNKVSNECIRRIRKIAPTVKILVGGYYNNSVEAVKDLDLPYDKNIIYNFHCYEPLIFTHQGAHWIPTMDTSFRMKFDVPYSEMDKGSKRYLTQAITGFEGFDPEEHLTPAYFEKIFEEAVKVAEERDVPLYCGEYGVIDFVDPEDILKWYKTINPVFEKYGIGRACWTYRSMSFGISDERMDKVRDELIKYL